ncbi:MAG: hypothetical protein AMXMBFR4_11250 [Candidatus Hydrogenedentota bacterium]
MGEHSSTQIDRRAFLERVATHASFLAPLRPSVRLSTDPNLTITAVGDVTLGYHFPRYFDRVKSEWGESAYAQPLGRVRALLASSDVCLANCEGTLTTSDRGRDKAYVFKGPPELARCLSQGGVTAVNLANNHFMDFGEAGAKDTLDACLAEGIQYYGGGRDSVDAAAPLLICRNGVRLGVLGCALVGRSCAAGRRNPGTNPCTDRMYGAIRSTKSYCDVVAVSCHWGVERQTAPVAEQVRTARRFIDAGADIVFGHHPHVLQGIERYAHGVIFYSLGNFAFGGNLFPADRDSIVARVTCGRSGVRRIEFAPVVTHPAPSVFEPFVPAFEHAERITKKVEALSRALRAA